MERPPRLTHHRLELTKSVDLPREVKCASLHPSRKAFATGSMSELWARVYDYESGSEIACQKGHHGPVRCIAFSPIGNAYASGWGWFFRVVSLLRQHMLTLSQ